MEATISSNKNKGKLWETAGVMFNEGSKYNMVSKSLVARLKLEPQTEGNIRKPIGNKSLIVVDMLREDGTTARIRAHVVDLSKFYLLLGTIYFLSYL